MDPTTNVPEAPEKVVDITQLPVAEPVDAGQITVADAPEPEQAERPEPR